MPFLLRIPSALSVAIILLATGLVTGCEKSAPVEIEAALKSIDAKDTQRALIHLKNAAAADPKNAKARFLLGQQLAVNNELPAAVTELKRALELKYPADELGRPLADALLMTGQPAQVLMLVAPLEVRDPQRSAKVQAAIAWAHLGLTDLPAVRLAVGKADAAGGPTPETRLIRARLADAEGNAGLALSLVDALVKDDPRNDTAWTFKGQLHERHPDGSEQALEAYRTALSISAKNYLAQSAIVGIQLAKQDLKAAREGLEAMRKLGPAAFMTYYYDGQMKFLDGNYTAARSHFQAALNLAADSPVALLASGKNELKLKALALAESQLARTLQLQPSNVEARFYLARAYLAQGKPDQALTTLAPLVDAPTPVAEAMLVAAQSRILLGDPKGADQLFERAAKLHSGNESVRLALAIMAAAKGNTDAGVKELARIAANSEDSQADIQLISTFMVREQYPAALEAIQGLERKEPKSAMADDLKGQVLLKAGNKAEARSAFENALKKNPLYNLSVANLAELDLAEGHPDQAKRRLEAQAKRDPTNPDLHIALATLAQRTGENPETIVSELDKAIRSDPRNARARLMLIDRHYSAGDINRALDAAHSAVAGIPDNAQLYEALARSLWRAGDVHRSLAAYVKLTQIAPREPAGYLGQANLLLAKNSAPDANKALQQLLAFAPGNLEARRLSVSAAILQKQHDKALALSRELQRELPSNPLGFALEGEVHMDQKRWEPAVTAFRNAAEKPGGEPFVTRQYSALLSWKRPEEAARVVADWTELHPTSFVLLRQVAATAYDSGDRTLAQTYYEKALKIAPNDLASLNNLAWILVEAKDARAQGMAERAAALMPGSPDVLDTLAQAYALNGDLKKAIDTLRRAIQLSSTPAPLRLRLARMYVQNKDLGNAKAELESLRELGKSFPEQTEVRKLLAQIR